MFYRYTVNYTDLTTGEKQPAAHLNISVNNVIACRRQVSFLNERLRLCLRKITNKPAASLLVDSYTCDGFFLELDEFVELLQTCSAVRVDSDFVSYPVVSRPYIGDSGLFAAVASSGDEDADSYSFAAVDNPHVQYQDGAFKLRPHGINGESDEIVSIEILNTFRLDIEDPI